MTSFHSLTFAVKFFSQTIRLLVILLGFFEKIVLFLDILDPKKSMVDVIGSAF